MYPVGSVPSLAGSVSRAGRQVSDGVWLVKCGGAGLTWEHGSRFESRGNDNAWPVDAGHWLGSQLNWVSAEWHGGDGLHARVPEEHDTEPA